MLPVNLMRKWKEIGDRFEVVQIYGFDDSFRVGALGHKQYIGSLLYSTMIPKKCVHVPRSDISSTVRTLGLASMTTASRIVIV